MTGTAGRPVQVGDLVQVPNLLPKDHPGHASAEHVYEQPGRVLSVSHGWAMVDLGEWGHVSRPTGTLHPVDGVPAVETPYRIQATDRPGVYQVEDAAGAPVAEIRATAGHPVTAEDVTTLLGKQHRAEITALEQAITDSIRRT